MFYPIRSKTKTNRDSLARVFPLSVITSSFDWFTVLCVFFVIGLSNYFGFGFTTLNWKPLYCMISRAFTTKSLLHSQLVFYT